jgi:hypothetical protein
MCSNQIFINNKEENENENKYSEDDSIYSGSEGDSIYSEPSRSCTRASLKRKFQREERTIESNEDEIEIKKILEQNNKENNDNIQEINKLIRQNERLTKKIKRLENHIHYLHWYYSE